MAIQTFQQRHNLLNNQPAGTSITFIDGIKIGIKKIASDIWAGQITPTHAVFNGSKSVHADPIVAQKALNQFANRAFGGQFDNQIIGMILDLDIVTDANGGTNDVTIAGYVRSNIWRVCQMIANGEI
jgi:hypothetical protein